MTPIQVDQNGLKREAVSSGGPGGRRKNKNNVVFKISRPPIGAFSYKPPTSGGSKVPYPSSFADVDGKRKYAKPKRRKRKKVSNNIASGSDKKKYYVRPEEMHKYLDQLALEGYDRQTFEEFPFPFAPSSTTTGFPPSFPPAPFPPPSPSSGFPPSPPSSPSSSFPVPPPSTPIIGIPVPPPPSLSSPATNSLFYLAPSGPTVPVISRLTNDLQEMMTGLMRGPVRDMTTNLIHSDTPVMSRIGNTIHKMMGGHMGGKSILRSFQNIFTSIFIILDRTFDVFDWIPLVALLVATGLILSGLFPTGLSTIGLTNGNLILGRSIEDTDENQTILDHAISKT